MVATRIVTAGTRAVQPKACRLEANRGAFIPPARRLPAMPAIVLGFAVTFGMVVGCGGGKPATPPPNKIIPQSTPITVPGNPTSPKTNTATNSATPANVATPEKSIPLPPGTDPLTVLNVVAVNTPFDVVPQTSSDENKFIVESGKPGVDSSQLTVAAVAPSTKGLPKQGFTLPAGFVAIPEAGYSDDGLPLRIRCQKADSTLALVPAGVVRIGTDSGPPECQPEFAVHIDTFYMDVFEVTVQQFETYRSEMKEKKKPIPTTLNGSAPPNTPVLGVTWGTAQAYARWAGVDLPTEVEFEKASRGPNSFRTPWGDSRAVWPNNRKTGTITPVGSYAGDLSPYGVYDLAGNAREWCNDLYSEQAHREAGGANGQAPHNWQGPKKATVANQRTVKGNGPDWSAWHRQGREVGKGHSDVGFRCVLRIVTPEPKNGT